MVHILCWFKAVLLCHSFVGNWYLELINSHEEIKFCE